ncbi:MAG: hypothetical protein PHE51_04905 [Eubacteriales bacterium]|nr:hypothetical protein [Eubacteriales bacterium]
MAIDYNTRVQGRIGQNYGADGISVDMRQNRTGALVTADESPKYYEMVSRGQVFSLTLEAGTTAISAGNLINAAAAASTQFALWNPSGSGKNIALLKFGVMVISGTSPISGLMHSFSATAPTIASSAVDPVVCNNVGLSASCVAGYLTHASGSNLTGSTQLKTIRSAHIAFSAGTFAALGGYNALEILDGDIVLPPNTAWVPTWQAAGTSMLVGYSITWAELPA